MLRHFVVFLEIFVEPKFTIPRTIFLGWLFVFFFSLHTILSKNT